MQNDWGEEQDQSLDKIKEIMSSEPILMLTDLSQEFCVHVISMYEWSRLIDD